MPYKDNLKQKESQKQHYQENKDKYKSSKASRKIARQFWYYDIKSKARCKICLMSDIRCLDFHHIDPSNKLFSITDGVKQVFAETTILKEIEKCEVLCANCHRIRHYRSNFSNLSIRIIELVNYFNEFKILHGCKVCKIKNEKCLDFHHKYDKIRHVSNMIWSGYSKSKILDEASKCDIICANCHRIEHNGNQWMNDSTLVLENNDLDQSPDDENCVSILDVTPDDEKEELRQYLDYLEHPDTKIQSE